MPQKTIAVYNPQGVLGDIPADYLPKAIAAGFKVAPQQQIAPPDPISQAQMRIQGIIEGSPEAAAQQAGARRQADIQALSQPKGVNKAVMDAGTGFAKKAGKSAYGLANTTNAVLRNVLPYGEKYIPGEAQTPQSLEPKNMAEKVGGYAETAAELYAPTKLVLSEVLPSARRAGQVLESIKGIAGHVPLDVNATGDAAIEAQRLAQSGGRMPKVVNDFLRRVTDPAKPPLNFAEGRDFYSNATRLSADEFNKLTPVMKLQVGRFTAALQDALTSSAGTVGQANNYTGAVSEFHNAMRLQRAGKVAKGAAVSAAGLGTAYGLYKAGQK